MFQNFLNMSNGNLPEWIQAISAVAALIIAFGMLFQKVSLKGMKKAIEQLARHADALEKQSTELANQTSHLATQAETLLKQFNLEKEVSREKRFPVFEKDGPLSVVPGALRYNLHLKNIGRKALNVTVIRNTDGYNVSNYDNTTQVSTNGIIGIEIRVYNQGEWDKGEFDFTITFKNTYGIESWQRIVKIPNEADYVIHFSKDLI